MFKKKLKRLPPLVIFALCITVLLITLSILLIGNIRHAKKIGAFEKHAPISDLLLKNKQANKMSVGDIDQIDSWMTFQYINFVFTLPESYLREKLSISDPVYPNISIRRYVKMWNQNQVQFLQDIKNAVRDYLTQNLPK